MTPAPRRGRARFAAVVTAVWLLAGAPLAAVEYFRADRFGTPLAALAGAPGSAAGFVLAVDSAAEAEAAGLAARRLLLKDGAAVREWRRIAAAGGEPELEQELEEGRVVAERRYDAAGLLQEERHFSPAGELRQREVLVYRGSDLRRVERYDAGGALLATDSYDLTAAGRLRRFTRIPAAGRGGAGRPAVLGLVFRAGELIEERHGAGDGELIVRAAGGAEYAREEWAGERLLAAQRPAPGGPGAGTSFDGRAATRSETIHDARGRPTLVRVYAAPAAGAAGALLEEQRYQYHPDGTLASLEVDGGRGLETYRYAYDGAGRRVREEYRRRGRLLRVTTFPAPGERVEEVYGADGTVWRVFWRDQTREREELLRAGEVVRTRDLAPLPAPAPGAS